MIFRFDYLTYPRLKVNLKRGGVGRTACWSYVTWYHELNGAGWATWEPGREINPGDIGGFTKERQFLTTGTLKSHGISSAKYSRDTPIGARFYRSASGLRFHPKVSGQSAAGFHWLGKADAGLRITAESSHACVLQMLEATEKSIVNKQQVMDDVLALIRQGGWSIDWQVVMSSIRSRRGFAAISTGAGQRLELKAAGHMQAVIESLDLGGAEFALASDRAATDFTLYKFSEQATPVFGAPVRVKPSLWDRLLPWRREGEFLIGPDGRRYPPRMLPALDLSAFAPEDRRYDPARSAVRPAELAAMTAAEVFEEVTSLADVPDEASLGYPADAGVASRVFTRLAEIRRFRLPPLLTPAPLAAADDSDEVSIRLDTSSPSGMARFIVYDRGAGEYLLEITPAASVRLPAVVLLRYGTTGGEERELIIPVADHDRGRPSSAVDLEDYSALAPLEPSDPVPLGRVDSWPEETVQASVRAAATAATADAWERLAVALPSAVSAVITRELRGLRNEP
jgi:hypothetical protein